MKPRHWNWARGQQNVPLPSARFTLYHDADPQYFPGLREMYLPTPGRGGWTYWDERVLFLHELGHVFDFTHLNRAERNQFRAAVGHSLLLVVDEGEGTAGRDVRRAVFSLRSRDDLPERDAFRLLATGGHRTRATISAR